METDQWPGSGYLDGSDGPPPSEMENQVRLIVQKQMETKITLNSQFDQHREFQDSGELRALPASSAGLHSIQELQSLNRDAQELAKLSRAGMNDREIALYLQAAQGHRDTKEEATGHSFSCEPSALEKRLQELRDRLARSEELEEARLNAVTLVSRCQPLAKICKLPQDPFTHIAEFSKKFDTKRKRRKREKAADLSNVSAVTEENGTEDSQQVDASQWHVVVPLEEEDILTKRLPLEDIQKIPRFAAYHPGQPNSVLYLKNLHPKTCLEELIAVFGRYDRPEAPIRYRLMTGRMRGQAFLHFSDVETATRALELANGYQLRDRPVIITYAKQKDPDT